MVIVQISYFSEGPAEYYNDQTLCLTHILYGLSIWTFIMPFVSLLIDLGNQQGIIYVWMLGLPIIGYISMSRHSRKLVYTKREQIVKTPENLMSYIKNLLYHLDCKKYN